jgi:hypothetical protein
LFGFSTANDATILLVLAIAAFPASKIFTTRVPGTFDHVAWVTQVVPPMLKFTEMLLPDVAVPINPSMEIDGLQTASRSTVGVKVTVIVLTGGNSQKSVSATETATRRREERRTKRDETAEKRDGRRGTRRGETREKRDEGGVARG